FIMSIIGQVSDLVESAIKRAAGVKDSGNWIPGHGGLLDVFDSTILTAPFLYYWMLWQIRQIG
ncbi:MAG: phosphatidate cytidylyltransferase, partial [bacterium]|nr:phosphatidate cytidylyltransferase [bacterium]